MTMDESFKKPGAVPFKWEIRPGVPKAHPDLPRNKHRHERKTREYEEEETEQSLSPPPRKLKPPPSVSQLLHQRESRTHSFRSAPRARSDRWHKDLPVLAQPVCVSPGCFPGSPILKRREDGRAARGPHAKPKPEAEPDYLSDLDRPTRRLASSRKSSVSPFRNVSPSSSSSYSSFQSSPRLSFSSYWSHRSSPQPKLDSDWASFGLF